MYLLVLYGVILVVEVLKELIKICFSSPRLGEVSRLKRD